MDTSSPSKRRLAREATDPASPGPKRLAQHSIGPDPVRGKAASLEELNFEVRKLHEQGAIDADYFKQIQSVTDDHSTRISIMNQFAKKQDGETREGDHAERRDVY